MKRRIIGLILSVCILLAAPTALLCFAFGLPAQYDETYLAALSDKLERLQTAPHPRIIFVGGSGAAFDVRSDLVETELDGYSVVNCGLYAGLGTAVMLDLVAPYVQEGDIVVFLPEQSAQPLSTFFSAESLWQATDGSRVPLLSLTGEDRGAMLGAFATFAGSKARLFFEGGKPTGDAVYARRSFNRYGDIDCAGRDANRMTTGYDPNFPITFDPALLTDALAQRINGFAAHCRSRGATLYFGFCAMNEAAIREEESERIPAYLAALEQRLDCPVLGAPMDAIMEADWFFDTNFHLNEAGQIAYTARLARLLKNAFGDGSPVSIEVPAMPGQTKAAVLDGDNSDAVCFTFAVRDGAAWITGLSEAGKGRETLTVPATYDGLPVRGFTAAVFAKNTALCSVTIGPNVTTIADYAFEGCTSLERIILQNLRPESCSVGTNLLAGTDARIVVPPGTLSAYATNYFWSPYAARMEEQMP